VFALCLRNQGYEASLERRKIYEVLPDRAAARYGQVRVVDESGDDYLYPSHVFAFISVPSALARVIRAAV
jgi:hypothetical protein